MEPNGWLMEVISCYLWRGTRAGLTDLLLIALNFQLQCVLQVVLETLFSLDLLLQEQDLSLELLLQVVGGSARGHDVLPVAQHQGLQLLPRSKTLGQATMPDGMEQPEFSAPGRVFLLCLGIVEQTVNADVIKHE